jgi:hypothetical protein
VSVCARSRGEAEREPLREFDLRIETPDGQTVTTIEVTSVENPVAGVGDVTNGVRHAAGKVADREKARQELRDQGMNPDEIPPIAGNRQVVIHMSLAEGRETMRKTGLIREIESDGTMKLFLPDGKTPVKDTKSPTGNLYADIELNLSKIDNDELLDRVTLVDQHGKRIVFVRDEETWTWTNK